MSLKKVRISVSQECAVAQDLFPSAGSPLHGEGMRHRMGNVLAQMKGEHFAEVFTSGCFFSRKKHRNERWPLTSPCEFCNDR